jgi:hypothetical protein
MAKWESERVSGVLASEADVERVRALKTQGKSVRAIAGAVGLSKVR